MSAPASKVAAFIPERKESRSNSSLSLLRSYYLPRIIFTVIKDLTCDQRMHRICNSLANDGWQVGKHSFKLNTSKFSKGVYLVKLISDFGSENQKLMVQ